MVNTLELRGIETYSPEIQTFLREIEKSFLQVLNNYVPADQQEKEADILELFVPTFFHQLPVNLSVTQLDDSNSSRYYYNYNYHTWIRNLNTEDFELNYLEIQPLVIPSFHITYETTSWNKQDEIILGVPITVVRRIPTANLTWLKSLVENYGIDTFKRFAIFCDDWHIWDLHEDNIGFLRTPEVELPIILDWMSD